MAQKAMELEEEGVDTDYIPGSAGRWQIDEIVHPETRWSRFYYIRGTQRYSQGSGIHTMMVVDDWMIARFLDELDAGTSRKAWLGYLKMQIRAEANSNCSIRTCAEFGEGR